MGQISLPVLNRTGYTMFWASTWENLHNFQQNLKEDLLIRLLIPSFFSKAVINTFFFFNTKLFFKNSFLINPEWSTNTLFSTLNTEFLDVVGDSITLPTYFNKIWILRFQNWVLVFFVFYKPSEKIINLADWKNQLTQSTDDDFNDTEFELFSALTYHYLCERQLYNLKSYYSNTKYSKFDF